MATSFASSPITWAHRDKETTRWANYGLAFCLGIIAASALDNVPDLWVKQAALTQVQTTVVPQLKKKLVIEHSATVSAVKDRDALCSDIARHAPGEIPAANHKCPGRLPNAGTE